MLSRRRDRVAPAAAPNIDLNIALRGGLFDDDFFRASVGYAIGERMVEMKRDFLPLRRVERDSSAVGRGLWRGFVGM